MLMNGVVRVGDQVTPSVQNGVCLGGAAAGLVLYMLHLRCPQAPGRDVQQQDWDPTAQKEVR